jgi:hypothetical protein
MADPRITIAGKSWRIPLLAPRQNRAILPLLCAGPHDYHALCEIVFIALTRAHPGLTRDEFDDWPIPACELVDALPVIARQTGFLGPRTSSPHAARMATVQSSESPDWDAIIARFVNYLPGTTPDYWEDALTAPRLKAMREEWHLHPPLAVLAAGWLGYKPTAHNEEALSELLRLFPSGKLTAAPKPH